MERPVKVLAAGAGCSAGLRRQPVRVGTAFERPSIRAGLVLRQKTSDPARAPALQAGALCGCGDLPLPPLENGPAAAQ